MYEVDAAPVVIALVDTSVPAGPPAARAAALEALELVRSALAAAVEGLPPAALFGLVSFADSVRRGRAGAGHPWILEGFSGMDAGCCFAPKGPARGVGRLGGAAGAGWREGLPPSQ